MRKFIIAVILLFGISFLITHLAQVEAIVETLQRGDWRFLLLALIVQIAWLVNVAASYRSIYRALDIYEALEKLFVMAAAASFVNVVTPSGMVGGMTLFLAQAKRKGYSTARVTLAGVLFVLFEYAAILCVVAVGLMILFRRNNLTGAEVLAAGMLFLIAMALAALLALGMRSEHALDRTLTWFARMINRISRRIVRRDVVSEARAHEFAHDAASGMIALRGDLRNHPENMAWPFALALSNRALSLLVFFLMFMAFKTPYSPGTIIAGFAIGYLFTIVSPTPAGIGVVEGILTVTLRSLNVPLSSAIVITLAYRGFTFWLPLLFGLIAFRFLDRAPAETVQSEA